MIDLTKPQDRTALAKRIKSEIDAWCVANYDDGPRRHLGASLIGDDCSRRLWYVFRWAYHEKFDGRMQRLFNRGHLEESRFIGWLKAIGWTVKFEESEWLLHHDDSDAYLIETDPTKLESAFQQGCEDVTGDAFHVAAAECVGVKLAHKQMRISGVGGHFGGSLDGEATPPESWGIGPVAITFVTEYKTNGPSPTFTKMIDNGVRVVHPKHYAQMCVYGRKRGHRYGLYMFVNKADENLHVEIVELDWNLADRLEMKAGMIIGSQTPPAKLSESASHQTCAWCAMKGICHQGMNYERNCRSCRYAQPVDGGQWGCHRHNQLIPPDFIPKGCELYEECR